MSGCPGGVAVSSIATKAPRRGFESISGWLDYITCRRTLSPPNRYGYLASSAGEIEGGLVVMLATSVYLCIWLK